MKNFLKTLEEFVYNYPEVGLECDDILCVRGYYLFDDDTLRFEMSDNYINYNEATQNVLKEKISYCYICDNDTRNLFYMCNSCNNVVCHLCYERIDEKCPYCRSEDNYNTRLYKIYRKNDQGQIEYSSFCIESHFYIMDDYRDLFDEVIQEMKYLNNIRSLII